MKASFSSIKKRSRCHSPSISNKKSRVSKPPGAPRKNLSAKKPKLPPRLAKCMSTYRRYSPGLGHDGDGLYGALTNNSLKNLMENLDVKGTRVVDIGAADGKVLLAALGCGAISAHGVEVAGDVLETKFDSMVNELRKDNIVTESQRARLRCKVNVAKLPTECGDNVESMLAHYFPQEFGSNPDTTTEENNAELVIVAVWHGFNVEAKQALLRSLSKSKLINRFVVVGPQNFPYGRSDEILEFLKDEKCKWRPKSLQDLVVKLSGGGETYRATVIGK